MRASHPVRAFALLSLLTLSAAAEPSESARKTEAAERFDRGLALFEEGNNAAALAEFLKADELVSSPVVRFNVGLVYAAMGQSVIAVDTLSKLVAPGAGLDDAQRERARAAIAEQAARIGRVEVTTNVAGSRVEVDDLRVGVTPLEPVRVAVGTHFVSARADGYGPERREISVASGVTVPVHLELTASKALAPVAPIVPIAAPAVAVAPSTKNDASLRETPVSNAQVTWGWISVVGGAAAATVGGIWLGVNAKQRSDAKAEFDSVRAQAENDTGVCNTMGGVVAPEDCNAEIDRVTANYQSAHDRSDVPAYVALGVGGTAIGVGIVLLMTAPHSRPSSRSAASHLPTVQPMLTASTRGAVLTLKF